MRIISIITVGVLALGGCSPLGNDPTVDSAGATGDDGKPLVLTTFTVLADMARNVAGDHLTVESITAPDEEIHDYQPRPADIAKAERADLILSNGLGLERWFDRFVADSKAHTAVVSDGVESIPIASGDYQGKANPHAWMSPSDGRIYVDNIAKAFAELDPDHAQDYRDNAAKYGEQITEVGTTMRGRLADVPQRQRALVTCEGAFSYLARDAGLEERYLWAVNAEGALSPQQVKDTEQYVREHEVPAVFCESTVDNRMQPVVESTGVPYGGTLYVDSLSDKDGPVPTYLDLLRYDAETITNALTAKGA